MLSLVSAIGNSFTMCFLGVAKVGVSWSNTHTAADWLERKIWKQFQNNFPSILTFSVCLFFCFVLYLFGRVLEFFFFFGDKHFPWESLFIYFTVKFWVLLKLSVFGVVHLKISPERSCFYNKIPEKKISNITETSLKLYHFFTNYVNKIMSWNDVCNSPCHRQLFGHALAKDRIPSTW